MSCLIISLLPVLTETFITAAEQNARLNGLGVGYRIPINPQRAHPANIVISSDEEDTRGGYPSGPDSDSDDSDSPSTTNPAPAASASPSPDTTNPAADLFGNEEDEEAKPGTYLECQVCGTLFDLVPRKKGQPWYVVFIGRIPGIYRSL